jgi:hypothetical protein
VENNHAETLPLAQILSMVYAVPEAATDSIIPIPVFDQIMKLLGLASGGPAINYAICGSHLTTRHLACC